MVEEVVLNTEVEKRYAPPSIPTGEVAVEVDPELEAELSRIPDKLAFKIGEVADLLNVKAYVPNDLFATRFGSGRRAQH